MDIQQLTEGFLILKIIIGVLSIALSIAVIDAILKLYSINNKMDELLRNQNDIENLQLNTQNEIIDILKKIEMNTRQRN